jgi:Protein of unknown function (DUF3618)
MSEHYDNRSPEEIQRDIERTRAEMGATIETIRQKMSPGELLDQALDYFKHSGPSQFTSNLGETVKNNPVPVTLIGLGIGWLMLAGSRDRHPSQTWPTSSRVQDRMGAAASSTADRAGQMMQGARERTGAARERMGEMTRSAQERVGEASARLGEMAEGARYQMGEAADRVRYQVRSQSAQVRDTFNYLRDEQPLILGVLGFALGAAFGAGLPPTRREDELMGEMRDEAMHRAREVGAEQFDKAQRVATAASEAATEQADKEGFSRQSADQRQREAGDTRDHTAQAESHATKEEACEPAATSQPR